MTSSVDLEYNGGWIPDGHQEKKIRRPRKKVPEFAGSKRLLAARVLGPALRRYRIAYLYWLCGWNAREVAEEMHMTTAAVKSVLSGLRQGEVPAWGKKG